MVSGMIKTTALVALLLVTGMPTFARNASTPNGPAPAAPDFAALATEFVYTTLSFSPSGATANGLHHWTDPKTGTAYDFDQMLDDYSPAELARQRAWYADFRTRLAAATRSRAGSGHEEKRGGAAVGACTHIALQGFHLDTRRRFQAL